MSAAPEDRSRTHLWLWLALLLAGIAALGYAAYVARDPIRRRRALRRAGRAWLGIEDAADRSSRAIGRRRVRREEEAVRRAREGWDDARLLPVVRHPIPPVLRRPYAHGSFMGAAPLLLGDSRWRRILAFLMPDVSLDVRRAAESGAGPRALIPMFENNPVMAAFGTLSHLEGSDVGEVEWDVFLSAEQIDAWELADDGAKGPLLRRIVDTMVIAHATPTDTVQEQLGLCQWADVRKTRKSGLGGVELGAWMDLYARALLLAESGDLAAAIGAMADEPRIASRESCLDQTFARPIPEAEAAAIHRRITGRERFSVVIELKSVRFTLPLLVGVVAELNRRGVHVSAVGSFRASAIEGVSAQPQEVDGRTLPGPREIALLHFADDLGPACEHGHLRHGACAMFNGASLLRLAAPPARYEVDEGAIAEIAQLQERFSLALGLYVQESDCDAVAVALLSELVTQRPATFALGFAWGGVRDQVVIGEGAGDHRGFGAQGAFWRLRRHRRTRT